MVAVGRIDELVIWRRALGPNTGLPPVFITDTLPRGRYLQYQLWLETDDPAGVPAITDLRLYSVP